jgi:hypothetical protein
MSKEVQEQPTPGELEHVAQFRASVLAATTAAPTTTVHPISVDAALGSMDECVSAFDQSVCPACNDLFELESHTPLVMPCLHSI